MSSFDLISNLKGAAEQQVDGEKQFLTQEEREVVKRLLSFPEEFPPEFGAWLVDYLGTAGVYQKYQVQGLPLLNTQVQDALQQLDSAQIIPSFNRVDTTETYNQASFGDLPSAGPSLTSLEDGFYVLLFGAGITGTPGSAVGIMGLSTNGSTPSDNDAIHCESRNVAVSGGIIAELRNGGSNSVVSKYRSVGSVDVTRRWLLGLKIAS